MKFNIKILVLLATFTISLDAYACQEEDYTALRALYLSTDGDNWSDKTGWLTAAEFMANLTIPAGTDVGTWHGVTTNSEGCVRSVSLINNNLNGSLPPEIGNWEHLQLLLLGENQLSGNIPPEISGLRNVQHLRINNNQLTGNIPPEFGNLSRLAILYLHDNQLTGGIPAEMSYLGAIIDLQLYNNQLSGCFPYQLFNLCLELGNPYYGYYNEDNITGGNNFDVPWADFCDTGAGMCDLPPCECPDQEEEYAALRELYLNTNGDEWISADFINAWPNEAFFMSNPTLTEDVDMRLWFGIKTDSNCCVSHIDMSGDNNTYPNVTDDGNNLVGEIPPEIGDFNHLVFLDFFNNKLNGNIPPETGNLTNLVEWDMARNKLSGSIPPEIGNLTDLEHLDFNNNNLSGSIPPEVGNLTQLTKLSFFANTLTGSPPAELENLTNMNTLSLSSNELSGTIPPELGNLTNLTSLYLNNNQFTGGIPPELWNLTNLKGLYLKDNQLTGNIPAGLGSLPNLEYLSLINNEFSGCYDAYLMSLCSQLDYYYNSNDQISAGNNLDATWEDFCATGAGTCALPACREDDYLALRTLYLDTDGDNWNNNTGWLTAVEFMANPTMPTGTDVDVWHGVTTDASGCVTELDLAGNALNGNIPMELGNLGSLEVLLLNFNLLGGSIPMELGDLSSLEYLDLSDNQFDGGIPAELGNLSSLQFLNLFGNSLSGNIPAELGNLDSLETLYLSKNQLSGSIPLEFGDLSNLKTLSLENNQFSGSIPPELGDLNSLETLHLENNQFSGNIPAEFGDLSNLMALILRNNNINGIPPELGNLTNLTVINLRSNQIISSIPSELGNLANLTNLYLSSNQFSGIIPPEFGNLSNLEQLELYNNQLSGCYDTALMSLCTQLDPNSNTNDKISSGNDFDAPWEDFCTTGAGTCTVDIDNTHQSTFTVYPLPSKDFVVFDVPNIAAANEIILYDITGKQISRQAFPQDKRLVVSHLNNGVYIYRIFYEDEVYSGKIVVE